MAFESGVASYIVGTATVEVYFPVDFRGNKYVRCSQCEYFSRNSSRCRLNGAICEFPDKFIGSRCPLNFDETERSYTNVPDDQ